MSVFVQLGATRDGLDPYLQVAHIYGMEAVLVETPDYIELRKILGRKTFDRTLAVAHPSNMEEVLVALESLPEPPAFILAGFERYIYTAYAITHQLHIAPSHPHSRFFPPHKARQRELLMRYSSIAQPRFHALAEPSFTESELTGLTFPLVLKPVDGGGGLGVFLVTSIEELRMALAELAGISNYDGGAFTGFILEEFLPGTEFSVQGIVHAGKCDILTQCQKFVTIEPSKDYPYLRGFKEVGHMAVSGQQADPAIRNLAQQCIERLAYDRGPFHMDMVLANERYYLLELGFRLSGSGLARLVQQVSGRDWAAETFAAHLDAASIPFYKLTTPASSLCIGQITAVSLNEINTAYLLQAEGYQVEVQIFTGAPSQFAASLQADLKRHGNLLGRVIVSGNSLEEVEYLLHRCAPNRTFSKNVLERHEEERINSI